MSLLCLLSCLLQFDLMLLIRSLKMRARLALKLNVGRNSLLMYVLDECRRSLLHMSLVAVDAGGCLATYFVDGRHGPSSDLGIAPQSLLGCHTGTG